MAWASRQLNYKAFDDREMPVYIFKIRRSPHCPPLSPATAPQRKSPVAGGGMKGELEEEQWLVCASLTHSDRGPGTAHILF